MEAGRMRHRLEVQTNSATRDASGQPIGSWTTQVTVWAAIEPFSGRELQRGDEQHAETTTRIITRFNSNITPEARLKEGSRIFEIQNVINFRDTDEKMEILVVETV